MTRDEFIQRAVIGMAKEVVDVKGVITVEAIENIVDSALELADSVEKVQSPDTWEY